MKRTLILLLILALFTGIALTAQVLSSRALAAGKIGASGSGWSYVQMNVIAIPEPAAIVLSSIVLLGSITLLRRHRLTRREL
jgi:hypothetical protein